MDMFLCAKTLGRRPGCVVMNIGAVLFDRTGRDAGAAMRDENRFYEPISAFDSHSHKLTSDPETLKWWRKQPSWQIVGEEFMNSNNSVVSVCEKLARFIEVHKPEKIWSNSPTFHIAVVNALYERAGIPSPIPYRSEMDYRTVMDLVYSDRKLRPTDIDVPGYPRQHAVGDAINQAALLTNALKDINPLNGLELACQKWLMLDIETLGQKPGCAIMSIGASAFAATATGGFGTRTEDRFYSVINSFDMQNCGFRTDPKTLLWWKKQSIWPSLSAEIRDSPVNVHKACMSLAEFIKAQKPDKVWANSPSFDIEIMRAMFKRMNIELPIAYRQEMDFRTVMDLAYPDRDNRPARKSEGWFSPHHALGDAMEQSVQTQEALVKLNLIPDSNMAKELTHWKSATTFGKRNRSAGP